MSFDARGILKRLGVSGKIFLVALLLLSLFVLLGNSFLIFLTSLVLIPVTFWLCVRGFRFIRRHSLWSLRNRLLLAYGLLGALPALLLFTLVGLGAWALMNELAIYLAGTALDRRLEGVHAAVDVLRGYPPADRVAVAREVFRPFRANNPGFVLDLRDAKGDHRFPPDASMPQVPAGWGNVHGLLVADGRFYAWSHHSEADLEIVALAPLRNDTVSNLVPHLGDIALVEVEGKEQHKRLAFAGSSAVRIKPDAKDAEFRWSIDDPDTAPNTKHVSHLPPPLFRLDFPVFIPATRAHYHLDEPGRSFPGVLWVYSRPSAVLKSFFSGTEPFREFLVDALIAVGIVFLAVELIAAWIGVSLSRRITQAVNQLYEGTRRVIHGDFRHRISVTDTDQLGDLAQSFNQMTGHLERLVAVEKEKERLQTELEIAREVQSQLYPKAAPPVCGLRLTVRCDPARMVSGDYYDYQQIASGKMVFAIGDVAGKGISAALLMATIQAALRAQITTYNPPLRDNECSHYPEVDASGLVSRLNKQIYAHTSPEKYATFFFALFDEQTRTLTYTNAGHLSPLLFRQGEVTPLDSNGTVVGAFPGAKYDESYLTMDPGDLLVCYTDGITEPENAYGEMFGEERLIDLVRRNATRDDADILNVILDAVRAWTGTPELSDDMTLLLARQIQSA